MSTIEVHEVRIHAFRSPHAMAAGPVPVEVPSRVAAPRSPTDPTPSHGVPPRRSGESTRAATLNRAKRAQRARQGVGPIADSRSSQQADHPGKDPAAAISPNRPQKPAGQGEQRDAHQHREGLEGRAREYRDHAGAGGDNQNQHYPLSSIGAHPSRPPSTCNVHSKQCYDRQQERQAQPEDPSQGSPRMTEP